MKQKKIQIDHGNSEINYITKGDGDIVLIFLHGWCINCTYWKAQIDHFGTAYATFAPDLVGFGNSKGNRSNWSIESYARDLAEFIEALDLQNIILIGHSMSGMVILQSVLDDCSRIIGLVGVDNFKDIDVVYSQEQMLQFAEIIKALKADFKRSAPGFADAMLFHTSTPAHIRDRIRNDFANTDPDVGYSSLEHFVHYSQFSGDNLEKCPLKLHLINSEATPTFVEGLENRCTAGMQVKSIGFTGHYPMLETPTRFNAVLEEIIDSILLDENTKS
ncbi:MAG: alpha/beta hydrolase [Saprospiraceae bacterium]|nr:alpha/beta hydrolase [Saprospiraceae bacterium]